MNETDTGLELLTKGASVRLAKSFGRRTFLSRLGKGTIALALGSAGSILLEGSAEAHNCPSGCDCSRSVNCSSYTGGGYGCPSGSCNCGSWCYTTSNCQYNYRIWTDCCGGCGSPVNCRCRNGRASCCNHAVWASGCGGGMHIKCRTDTCTTFQNVCENYQVNPPGHCG